MAAWSIVFFVAAIICAVLGFGVCIQAIAIAGRIGFVVFILMFMVSTFLLLVGPVRRPKNRGF